MTWLEIAGRILGWIFALVSVGALGLIALFALADREAARQQREKKRASSR